jgi:regulator of sigma E protease
MELLAQIPNTIFGALKFGVPFVVVLSIVVFIHEFGHYIVGRWCGIKAEVFSIGFGKKLFGWTDRRGTHWQVAVLPLGGFVKFVGDMDPASAGRADNDDLTPEENKVAFHNAGLLPRALTVAAGPFANFLLSVIVFAGISLSVGQHSGEPVIGSLAREAAADIGFEPGDRVLSVAGQEVESFGNIITTLADSDGGLQPAVVERGGDKLQIMVHLRGTPRVTNVTPGKPAARAGMLPGDIILSVDGQSMKTFRQLQIATIDKAPGAEMEVEVERGNERLVYRFVPEMVNRMHPVTGEMAMIPTMGVNLDMLSEITPSIESVPLHTAMQVGVERTWRIISGTMIYLHDMVFMGADRSQLGGPIRIAKISSDAADQGISTLIYLIAVLSTSIGLINLFPIPILDGGHLMFYAVELVRGRPVGEMWMRVGTMVGLSLVLLLMVFATYNDLVWLL